MWDAEPLREFMRRAGASSEELVAIDDLPWMARGIARHKDIQRNGSHPGRLFVILDGWAARYCVRRDGSRRVTGFMFPGDLCGIHAIADAKMDHSIIALTDCRIAELAVSDVRSVLRSSPAIERSLWHAKLMDEAILRKWLCNSTDAEQAVAHLLCEFHARLNATGRVKFDEFEFPVTQADVGDALGITAVHTNRMLKKLKSAGLINFKRYLISISDIVSLRQFCGFNPAYLHLR